MNKLNQMLALAGFTTVLSLGTANLAAQAQQPQGQQQQRQGRGNFDPEQMRQRMMDSYRERLEVKGDDEWKIIQERIQKVTDAQRDVRAFSGGGFGGFGRGGGRPGGDGNAPGGNDQGARRGGRGGFGGFGGEPSPEVEGLQKAIESKASADELKSKLAKVREARKDKEAKLEKAQDDLRKVLSVRQEAGAVLAGLLK
jgi:hypothetical protein